MGRNGSSIPRNTGDGMFSRSSHGEEDDVELARWAALERLPTNDRIRKGILSSSKGERREVEIESLGFHEKKRLIERLAAALEGQNAGIVTDYMLKILGLDVCADTKVGNRMVRGISGGQKKRLTTGEMFVGPSMAFFMDEISTGLDSSTAYHIVNSIRQAVHIFKATTVISLLQPAPETYNLFDDIIFLSDGQIVYQGPLEYVLEFFESMGFRCPERKGVADFLQEVTSMKDQGQYWFHKDEPYRFVPVKEFAEAAQSFHVGIKICDELAIPFDKSKSHPAALTTSRYGVNEIELLKVCFLRELLLMKRNSFYHIFKTVQLAIMAFIMTSVFVRTKMHRNTVKDGGLYLGAMFYGLFTLLFNEFAELPMTISKLPVLYKQRDMLFFPAWAYAISTWITKIPMSFLKSGIWFVITYYIVGFDPNGGRMFRQYLLLFLVNQMASGLFQFMAFVGRDMIIANTFGSFSILVVMVLSGLLLSREKVKKWWIWGYWISPIMYAENAILVNEFLGDSWKKVTNGSTETLGVQLLKSRGIFPVGYWYWIGVGALVGYIILFNSLSILALTYLKPFGKSHVNISEEELKQKHMNRTGENFMVELSSVPSLRGKASIGFGCIEGMYGEIMRNNISTDSISDGSDAMASSQEWTKGMVLPFTPLSLCFDDIRYSIDMPEEMKAQGGKEDRLELLKGVSGAFRPGVLTALMGVTGAGKTTLMDVLAGRKTHGHIDGTISISGYPKKQATFARVSGYCEQNDIHSPQVTVYESLLYSAWLRLPSNVNPETRKTFVEEVMELIELKSLRNALVGLPGVNGLSTEQRKRLTIAVELVANPSIIFMDEPTSGLDARAAAIVMRTVRNTVDTGRTVVCTIHQPSIDIFDAFDELFLMKTGGEAIYAGPLGSHSCHLIEYFEGINGVIKIKEGYNPATWMLEATSEAQEDILGVSFAEVYKNSHLYRKNKEMIEALSSPPPGSEDLYFPTQYSQPFLTQCFACLWKQHWSYWRNPSYTAMKFIFTFFIALLIGTMFWDLGSKRANPQDLFNAMGSMYASVLFIGTNNAYSVQPVVSVERLVFYRERAAGTYSALPYAIAQILIEIPYILVQALLYGVIVYAMIAFEWTTAKFFSYMFFMYFTLLYFTYFGMMTIAMTPDNNIASVVFGAFNGTWNLFSGFFIPRASLPAWWRWYAWACPVAWTLYGLVASQFGDVHTTFEDAGASFKNQTVAEFVNDYYGYDHNFLGVVAAMTIGFTVLFAFIFAFSVKVLNFQKR
ncbi:ABC transporter G family member 39 [Amborella trichopoda]|nr:ABC transporter G family member 39 [Amborella trichopoda]|eukprot:XP_020525378.1 ABC transporter G family member 39 [Amborella trichopoda]